MDLAFRTRDLARSAMVNGISGSRNSGGGIDSSNVVVEGTLGTAVVVEARSDGGADGAVSIDPVGSFFLGFGRGFFVATVGSAGASLLDVDATALFVMTALVVRGSGCRGFVVFRDCKRTGRSVEVAVSRGRGGGGSRGGRANLLSERDIPRLRSPQRGRPESSWSGGAWTSQS